MECNGMFYVYGNVTVRLSYRFACAVFNKMNAKCKINAYLTTSDKSGLCSGKFFCYKCYLQACFT